LPNRSGVSVKLAARIPKDLHRRVRIRCAEDEKAMRLFVAEAIRARLDRETTKGDGVR
jgi:hypothetical protein